MKRFIILLSALFCINAIAHTTDWYVDGILYQSTTCTPGDNITPPNPPSKPGYHLVDWIPYRIPLEYTELEYIESTGTQYIDTGIVTQNGIGFDVTFLTNNVPTPGSSDFGAILGGRRSSGNNDFQITTYTPYDSTMGTIRNGESRPVISAKISQNTKLHISLINDVITYDDGTTAPVPSYKYTATANIYLFGLNDGGSFAQSGRGCRIYNAKLLVGSNVVFNGIPAKNSSNVVGMYDTVSEQFFTNAGTGVFIAGPKAH